jgi:hypothetical protein
MNEMDTEHEPDESKSMELAKVVSDGDPELMLAHLEKKAALAGRMRQAIETVLISQTYPQDWTVQGDGDKAKACLGSAGAERVGRSFPIRYRDVKHTKEAFTDVNGEGYRYIYEGYAELYERIVYVQGSYSTRDAFLGKTKGEWRDVADINEGFIRNAAFHIFTGNAIKALLGLRGMPAAEYQRIMGGTKRDPTKSPTVTRGQGTQGGSSEDDSKHQAELGKLCIEIANMGRTVVLDSEHKPVLGTLSDGDERSPLDVAKDICKTISGFWSKKDNKWVDGLDSAKALKGQRLSITVAKARELAELLNATVQDGLEW